MSLETEALAVAAAFSDNETAGGSSPKERSRALSDAALSLFPEPSWRKLPTPGFPSTVTVLRGSVVRGPDLYVSTGGSQNLDAQCWRWNGTMWSKQSHFNNYRMNVLMTTSANDLIIGLGSQHVSGSARVWKYTSTEVDSQMGSNFSGQDIIYSMTWHAGDLYAGTMAEDTPGAARLKKWTGSAWVDVFAPGVNGAPSTYTYAGIYETWSFGGKLYIGTMSRTAGHAHVWRLETSGWVNLGGLPDATFILAAIEYGGKLLVAWGTNGNQHPIKYYDETEQVWIDVGTMPSAWVGATIFNHMAVFKGSLYVGVGGSPGKLSVWRLDGAVWTKVAGNNVNGSWASPISSSSAAEWIYRLTEYNGKLYASGAGSNAASQVWEMTLA